MSMSSNHTKAFVQCYYGKHTVVISRTLLSDHVFWLVGETTSLSYSKYMGLLKLGTYSRTTSA